MTYSRRLIVGCCIVIACSLLALPFLTWPSDESSQADDDDPPDSIQTAQAKAAAVEVVLQYLKAAAMADKEAALKLVGIPWLESDVIFANPKVIMRRDELAALLPKKLAGLRTFGQNPGPGAVESYHSVRIDMRDERLRKLCDQVIGDDEGWLVTVKGDGSWLDFFLVRTKAEKTELAGGPFRLWEPYLAAESAGAGNRTLSPTEMPLADWKKTFDAWMAEVHARANRYPPGFLLGDSRESIYEGCGE